MPKKKLIEFANNIFDDGSVANDNLFHRLLVERLAFKHEREVRLLYLYMALLRLLLEPRR